MTLNRLLCDDVLRLFGEEDRGAFVRVVRFAMSPTEGDTASEPRGMNRRAYRELIEGNLTWLLQQPRTVERDHIEAILRHSEGTLYGPEGEVASEPVALEPREREANDAESRNLSEEGPLSDDQLRKLRVKVRVCDSRRYNHLTWPEWNREARLLDTIESLRRELTEAQERVR